MPAIVVLGAQWGDEGKGKATDLLTTEDAIDFCVRTSGGHNAGHTIVVNGEKFATHLLPSGILTPGCTSVIANGVVVSPEALFRELDALIERDVHDGSAGGQRQRPRDRVVPLHGRQGHRALPRQEQDRHDRTRHRSGVRRQDQPGRHPGRRPLRREDPARQGRGGAGGQEPPADQGLQPARDHRRGGGRGAPGVRRAPAADGRRHLAAAQPRPRRRQDRALRGRPGHHARRRPRHLPVRDQQQPGLGRRLRRRRRRARPGSTGSSA